MFCHSLPVQLQGGANTTRRIKKNNLIADMLDQQLHINLHTNPCARLTSNLRQHVRKRWAGFDKRIAKAATFKLRCQSASIPEAMRASKFSLAKSSNPVKQMAVHRAYEKAIIGKTKAAPATVLLLSTMSGSSLSLMTELPGAQDSGEAEGKADTTYSDRDAEMASE